MLTNTLQYIDEIIVRIDVVQPAGHEQALHNANVFGAEQDRVAVRCRLGDVTGNQPA